jgi:hypothetical protein
VQEPTPPEPKPAAPAPAERLVSVPIAPGASAPADRSGETQPLLIPRPLPAETPGPTITRDGDHATARVPLLGSTVGMYHYSLTHPRGVAVNLPNARANLPIGLHLVRHDGFRTVWIRERPEGGIQIRFGFTRHPTPDEEALEIEPDAVTLRVALPAEGPATAAASAGE